MDPMNLVPDDVKLRLHQMAAGLQRLATCVFKRRICSFTVKPVPPWPPEGHDTGILVTLPDGQQVGCVMGETESHLAMMNDLVGQCVELPIGGAE